jgi:undecaprenyl diphosphate synthase
LGTKQSESDKKIQKTLKESGEIPVHIAIIMDGNGRWAKKRGLPRAAGHKSGIESVRDIVETCSDLGVKYLTLYTFSTENWKRPKQEVSTLMRLLLRSIRNEINGLSKNNVRLLAVGDIASLPVELQKELNDAIEKTKNNTDVALNLALSYSGRWDILEAVKKVVANKLKVDEIDEKSFSELLTTKDIPDPDLLIRTSGEFRVSNFLLWQIAYSEIFISDVFWPDFRRKNLYEAIKNFQQRERRFGKVSEQIKRNDKGI